MREGWSAVTDGNAAIQHTNDSQADYGQRQGWHAEGQQYAQKLYAEGDTEKQAELYSATHPFHHQRHREVDIFEIVEVLDEAFH